MLEWFVKTIGVGGKLIEHLDEANFAFQRPLVFWVGLVLLVPIGYYIYRRQRTNLSTVPGALCVGLSVTRVLILAVLVLVLAGVYLKIDHKIETKPIVAMVFDDSQSMDLPAGPFADDKEMVRLAAAAGYPTADGKVDAETRKALNGIGRAELAHRVFRSGGKSLVEPLAEKYDLRYYSFSEDLVRLAVDPGEQKLPERENPGGKASHLGSAILELLEEAAGQQVAGIVLFSDGQNTGGRSPAEAAHAAADVGAPIYTVPTGSATRLRDVSIVDVFAPDLMSVGDTARVAVTFESQGFDGRAIKVQLLDGEKVIDGKDLNLHGAEQQHVELTFKATEPGPQYLTVKIPPLAEEPEHLHSNNSDIAFVRVSSEKMRVLYIEGRPRWDFRFLKNGIRRDHGLVGRTGDEPDILLERELRRNPLEQAKAMPKTIVELAEYHTIILGDVSPALVADEFLDLLVEAVRERGVGLVVASGPMYMPHLFDERLKELLPVRLRPNTAGLEAPVYKPFQLELSPEGAVHETMRLYDDPGRNQNIWAKMPAYYWCAAAERPAPAASVLAWNPSVEGRYGKLPLVAYHFSGQGRVLFVGTDATWLWRQNVGDRFFYKFWGQAIRFVARRGEAESKKSWLEVRPVRAQPGEQAMIELMAFGTDGSPRTDRKVPVHVFGGGKAETVELTTDPSAKGRYTGRFTPQTADEYRIVFDPGGDSEPAEARIRVMVAPEELRHPNVNRPTLELLAGASGGKLVGLADLGTIPDRLEGEAKLQELHLEATVWDNWLTLAVLMFVYSLDVGLRRLAGLS